MCCLPPEAADFSEVTPLLACQISAFMRTLRNNAFTVGNQESVDAARLLATDVVVGPATFRSALKSLACARRSDWLKFDEVFDAFWLGKGMRWSMPLSSSAAASNPTKRRQLGGPQSQPQSGDDAFGEQAPGAEGSGEGSEGSSRMEGASRGERLALADFRHIHDAEAQAEAHALAVRLARRMRTRLNRRERALSKGRRVDLRATIRRNISHGGVPIELAWRKRKQKPLRLVILLDASGSMSLYTAVFVRFIHGVLDSFSEAEAFLFHTRLVHVSSAMRDKSVERALDRLSLLAQGVGGGTRIGESLANFNRWYAKAVIHSRTCVMIVSDGYDAGAPEVMAQEMRQLAKRCRRIVWLNPMMGWEGYEPVARGMQAALPHVDLFAPAHNLKSLAALEPYLTRL